MRTALLPRSIRDMPARPEDQRLGLAAEDLVFGLVRPRVRVVLRPRAVGSPCYLVEGSLRFGGPAEPMLGHRQEQPVPDRPAALFRRDRLFQPRERIRDPSRSVEDRPQGAEEVGSVLWQASPHCELGQFDRLREVIRGRRRERRSWR